MNPMLAEMRMFGGNFAPRAWALCDGQLLPINQNQALFSIIGTIYGGDGRTTFALPDMRGRAPLHPGNGPGLSSRSEGQKGGTETNTLNTTQLPSHNHSSSGKVKCNNITANSSDPTSNYFAAAFGRDTTSGNSVQINSYTNTHDTNMANDSVTVTLLNTGGNLSVNNMEPWLAVNFIICLYGVFPSRN